MATRILIADDNEAVRGRLGELLATHDGWEVCGSVASGREAVEKAVELRPSLIILDLVMPEMDGLSAAKEIGKTLPSVPIVMFTLHKFATINLEAKKAGVRYVVAKPDTETLLRVIDELAKSQAAEPAQEGSDLLAPASGRWMIRRAECLHRPRRVKRRVAPPQTWKVQPEPIRSF